LVWLLDRWQKAVGFFNTGFLMFKLCEGLEKVWQDKTLCAKKPEDAIWVASYRGVAVNRVQRIP
jgi:hypothetical protein